MAEKDYYKILGVEKARMVHGDKYDYSKVEYVNKKTNVLIICPKHGEFYQTPNSHIYQKSGCKFCRNEDLSSKRTMDNALWIKKVNDIHQGKYDYRKTHYTGYYNKVVITCPIHGDFEQIANDHQQGKGCPKCRSSHMERDIEKILQENKLEYICQYRPSFLVNGKSHMSLDFFLPQYNIAIECQGKQHFIGNTFYSRDIQKIIDRDKRKRLLCQENGINLVYYTIFPKYENVKLNIFVNKDDLLNYINNARIL